MFDMVFGQRRAMAAAHLYHATSEEEYTDIRKFGLRAPVAVIPNGVEISPLGKGNPRDKRSILYLGRLHKIKGLDILLKGWSKVVQSFPDWELRIVGQDEGGHLAELRALVQDARIPRVSFLPPVFGTEKDALLRSCDILVLPSRSENFGLVVAEALACETPVITTQNTPWSALRVNQCGWWIPLGVDSVAGCLSEAMRKPSPVLEEMGRRGREWISRDFAWHAIAQQFLKTYQWLLSEGDRPAWIRID